MKSSKCMLLVFFVLRDNHYHLIFLLFLLAIILIALFLHNIIAFCFVLCLIDRTRKQNRNLQILFGLLLAVLSILVM